MRPLVKLVYCSFMIIGWGLVYANPFLFPDIKLPINGTIYLNISKLRQHPLGERLLSFSELEMLEIIKIIEGNTDLVFPQDIDSIVILALSEPEGNIFMEQQHNDGVDEEGDEEIDQDEGQEQDLFEEEVSSLRDSYESMIWEGICLFKGKWNRQKFAEALQKGKIQIRTEKYLGYQIMEILLQEMPDPAHPGLLPEDGPVVRELKVDPQIEELPKKLDKLEEFQEEDFFVSKGFCVVVNENLFLWSHHLEGIKIMLDWASQGINLNQFSPEYLFRHSLLPIHISKTLKYWDYQFSNKPVLNYIKKFIVWGTGKIDEAENDLQISFTWKCEEEINAVHLERLLRELYHFFCHTAPPEYQGVLRKIQLSRRQEILSITGSYRLDEWEILDQFYHKLFKKVFQFFGMD